MKSRVLALALLVVLIAVSFAGFANAQQPVVRMLFFYSPTCPHCVAIIKDFMPPLMEKYGDQIEVAFIDITNPSNYAGLIQLEEAYGIDPSTTGVPEVFIGKDVLKGEIEIKEQMEGVIQKGLAAGGIDYPEAARLEPTGTGTPAPTPTPSAQAKPIALAYFYKPGCQECSRLEYDLELLQSEYPQLQIEKFDILEQSPLEEWLSERAGIPQAKRLVAPAVFIGDDYLVDEQVTRTAIAALIDKYVSTGASAFWQDWDPNSNAAGQSILDRFKSFGALTVAAAGLIDGLNPCAFATIVFFISYLAFTGRKGRDILLVGGSFSLGVFMTYTLVGFGLLKAVQSLPFMATLGRWVYLAVAAFTFVLAVLSVFDYFAARRGRPDEMRLRLPTTVRKRINKVIREGSGLSAFVAVAFGTGFVISLLELACTGQVYLPTILFVMGNPSLRGQAVSYLLLYNVLFIVPLLVVFGLAYAGTSSEKLAAAVNKQTATVKLLTAVIFFALAAWLFYSAV